MVPQQYDVVILEGVYKLKFQGGSFALNLQFVIDSRFVEHWVLYRLTGMIYTMQLTN